MIGGDTIKKYEKEILQSQLNDEKAVLEQLEQNYQQAIKDIDEKVAALLGRADADAASVVFQVEYQRQLRTQVQSILEQLQANEFETISEYLTQCYEEGFMGSLYSMQQQGVPLAFPINQEQVVMAVQTDSKISEGLYTRLGKDVSELKKNISAEIARGISTSLPYAQIAKNLNRQAQIGLNRAMRITRTEGGRIQNKAAMDTMTKAKAMGADVMKRWSAALDARTRDSHAKIDGEVKEIEEKFSNGLMYPKDPSGKASEVVNCRCKVQEKARWALTANQTKMLGDVSQMSDEQKEAIAKRLGVPVEDLDQYSGQIVPINAKSYDEFKERYKEIWNFDGGNPQQGDAGEETRRKRARKQRADITEGGKYTSLSISDKNKYADYIEHEYTTQKATIKEVRQLWQQDGGYIQNSLGYSDINSTMRGLKPKLDNPKCHLTMRVMMRLTANNELKKDYIGFRKVDSNYLKNVLGLDVDNLFKASIQKNSQGSGRRTMIPKDKASAETIAEKIKGLVGTDSGTVKDGGFTSVSLSEELNYFKHYPIEFKIQMPKGTKGFITSNLDESEFIAKNGSSIEIIDAYVYNDGGKDCIAILSRLKQ